MPRTETFRTRVEPSLAVLLQRSATEQGTTVSELLRRGAWAEVRAHAASAANVDTPAGQGERVADPSAEQGAPDAVAAA
jgi:hypothetical protein